MQATAKINWAAWKPLGVESEPQIGTPRVLIFHTMVGNLQGTYSMFRTGGYDGTESTFGLGGRWELGNLDGALWQFQYMGYQADAQFAGNAYADSVETADGGNPNNPWTTAQINTLVRLTVDWCKATGNPCQLVSSPSQHGLGYHALFHEWNTDNHACPGQVRIGQLKTLVIPKARAAISNKPAPHVVVPSDPGHLQVDGTFGHSTIVALQLACGLRGASVDGVFGPDSRRALQHHLGVIQDGDIGPITVKHWKAYLKGRGFWPWANTTITGVWDKVLTSQTQKALNAHKF